VYAATLAVLLGAAPGMAVAQAAAAQASPDQRELQAYVLSMDVLNKVAKANRTAMAAKDAAAAKDPAKQRLAKKKAELAALEAKDEPTEAEQERMMVLSDEIARAEEQDDDDVDVGDDWNEAMTIAGMARRIDTTPEAAAAVRAVGLSSREYATASLTLLHASLADAMLKQKLLKQVPPEVSKRNLEFVQAHAKEIEALGIFSEGRSKRGGATEQR
jgi:hypothetical protein